ncbi:hypothetical protein BABINDRAFT_172222 [Babjeviella inositovora NRRL Y-12698]|uniref:STAS domain-containing protein n=1 Tax=Babjeviella inositovora NRRL Y-12698 TaxID=984486 RepID=A0A1E3QLT1_9ASCO|nr:uncharacterized protein BABINDRAFT_172222 [Babjeviella inositovora NRRL Y-12698]ODQ78424.1 hypothetical protein BABINDRAFT_172222 [Babjeviella inositovora NRRL Y-12698]
MPSYNPRDRTLSISGALAEGFSQSLNPSQGDLNGGRSYVHVGSFKPLSFLQSSPFVRSGASIHEQTAELATIGIDEMEELPRLRYNQNDLSPRSKPEEPIPLLKDALRKPLGEWPRSALRSLDRQTIFHHAILNPVRYTPAVAIGTLLNILDALSYGMIMFPVSEAIFAGLEPTGLSMFYVSTVISQLVYSLGASAFKSAIGSEMIEITPFFHTMALGILAELGPEKPSEVITTTIVSFALSSVLTGLVFYALGKMRLGSLVAYFPRHTLISCIGGVGFFLLLTAMEVSARLDGGFHFDKETLHELFATTNVILQWALPVALTAILVVLQRRFHHHAMVLPAFFLLVFFLFHVAIIAGPWDLVQARANGWVFSPPAGREPWYHFYTLYDFSLVHWRAVLHQVPTMLALTFFGVLHVPINVPALAVSIGMDDYDVDRELVAHGLSNSLLGLCGSIQNYLVYTNSVLFIRAGADLRLSGVMLAAATAAVMCAGPVVIGYIPVCVVGALIFLLGYELLVEALVDTWGRVRPSEYATIVTVVIVMGVWDFVYGILVGILLACFLFVVEASRRPVVSGVFTGTVTRSTVLRHPKQQEFLKRVGEQICIVKLQGALFFGSIGGVEKTIRERFEEQSFKLSPVRYLILDMNHVASIDFSGAEGFRRIRNLMEKHDTVLIISSVVEDGPVVKALRDAGLWDGEYVIQLFGTLNLGLEWCENCFLEAVRQRGEALSAEFLSPEASSSGYGSLSTSMGFAYGSVPTGSPRNLQIVTAAKRTLHDLPPRGSSTSPLPLLMTTFHGLSTKGEAFWSTLAPLFVRVHVPGQSEVYAPGPYQALFLVESGLIKCDYRFEGATISSSVLPLTAFGDVSEKPRTVTFVADADCVVWRLDQQAISKLVEKADGGAVYNELLKIEVKLMQERFNAITSSLVVSS